MVFFEDLFQREAQEILIVGHLSWFWAMFAPGNAYQMFGSRQDHRETDDIFIIDERQNARDWLFNGGPASSIAFLITKA